MASELSGGALNLLLNKEKEPAVVSISDYTNAERSKKAETVSAKSILSKFNREEK